MLPLTEGNGRTTTEASSHRREVTRSAEGSLGNHYQTTLSLVARAGSRLQEHIVGPLIAQSVALIEIQSSLAAGYSLHSRR